MPQQIGDTLREARMRQKIDITEIEAKTKIRAKYLRAMENEEFDLLPGSTFAKSFLRTYAAAAGVGTTRFYQGIPAKSQPSRGRHIRINLGKTSVTITANGKHVPLAVGPNPAGIDFTPGKHKSIPTGSRPCA